MIIDAHRMNDVVSNKFLKTLEEPPERSLILLLTNEPEALLPTIVSRCQRIILPDIVTRDDADWHEPVLGILRRGPPRDTLMLLTQAGSYHALFGEEKKKAEALVKEQFKEDETLDDDTEKALVASEYRRTWQEMFRFIEYWYRDLYLLKSGAGAAGLHFNQEAAVLKKIAADMSYTQARRRLEQVPQMARRIDSNLPIQEVFEAGLAG
jgi:DNA polymerase-3 subunit delta'